LAAEIGVSGPAWGILYQTPEPRDHIFWHRNVWLEPFQAAFGSVSEAAKILRGIQRNWSPLWHTRFRRGALIREQLPRISDKPRPFPWLVPAAPMGAWTLIDDHTIIASAKCSSPFPGGCITFIEDKETPPSRAYLKLWEALTILRRFPRPGERCLDAGASPGGWTWAAAQLGAEVLAVDRSPLADRILALPGVEYLKHDAFTLRPDETGPVDWLLCDVICYPSRLFDWISRWLASGLCRNIICTIKMQGLPDMETTRKFAAIPGGQVIHLWHNKHELTWIYPLAGYSSSMA
jgi:23S rRNA (cytidine2498-2'-O)-methyltransferase